MGGGAGKIWLALAAVAAAVIIVVAVVLKNGEAVSRSLEQKEESTSRIAEAVSPKDSPDLSARSGQEAASPLSEKDERADDTDDSEENEPAPQTEEEKREAAEEKLVNDFDDLTDKWMKSSAKGVTMADIDNFAQSFRSVSKNRQDECVHRALNLIPDENVMLLAGILMDKTMDKKIVETVYNDILNRDEDVKKPILQQIFKDKTHPC